MIVFLKLPIIIVLKDYILPEMKLILKDLLNSAFEIEEGESLIEMQGRENSKELFFTSLKKSGKVVLILKTKFSLFPQKLEFDLAGDL